MQVSIISQFVFTLLCIPRFKLNILPDKEIVFGAHDLPALLEPRVSLHHVVVAHGVHVLDQLVPRAGEEPAAEVGLHTQSLDIHLVPRQGLQNWELGTLNVQAEVVDRGVAQGQQHGVHWEALHLDVFALAPRFISDPTHRFPVGFIPDGAYNTALIVLACILSEHRQ